MKLRIIFIFLCCVFILKSQESKNIDSLINHVYSLENNTEKVDKILDLFSYLNNNFNNEIAFEIANYSLKISKEIKYKKGEILSLEKLGRVYYRYNNFTRAKFYYDESLKLSIEIDDQKMIATNYRHLGALKHEKGFFKEGVDLLRKALRIHISFKDSLYITSCYNRISVFYRESKELDSALFYSNKAIILSNQLNFHNLKSSCFRNLAIIYLIKEDYNQSEEYFKKTLKLQEISSSLRELTFTKIKYAILLIKTKRHKEALHYLTTALESTNRIRYLKLLPVIYENISLAQYADGQYKNAYDSYNKFYSIQKELRYERENSEKILSDRIKLENQINQKEIDFEKLRVKNIQKLTIIIILIVLSIISFFMFSILKKRRISEILYHQKHQAAKEIIDQYEKIDNWIAKELHDDIGGSVSAIRLKLSKTEEEVRKTFDQHMKKGGKEIEVDIDRYILLNKSLRHEIENLSEVHNNIRNLSHNLVPVSFEDQVFSSLLKSKISDRFPEDMNLTFQIYPEEKLSKIDSDLKFNVYRILQSVSSNIILHSKAKNVSLQLVGHNNHLTIIAEDDGVGFDPKIKKDGLGLSLINKRVILFDGKIHIDSQKGIGSTIIIDLPYKTIQDSKYKV